MTTLSLLVLLTLPGADDELTVLQSDGGRPRPYLREYLRAQALATLDRRAEQVQQLRTREQIVARQQQIREAFLESLGGFPERTPLNARIVGRFDGDGYRGEKVIYESRPGFHVPAIVYLPEAEPPYPAVVVLCGHSENGKAYEQYQRVCILLAKNGLAALCPDPIGQGERKQVLDRDDHGHLTDDAPYKSTSEHMVCGVAPILLGRGLGTYMIWDGMRAIDYLQSRGDIDGSRIGCTGNSGGGNRTSYLMAIDDRITCAAPGCFITTTRRKNDRPGPGDAEQNTFGRIALGIEHADYITMRAPIPTLICSATHDFVPIEGAWETFREAKQIYTKLGHSERIDLVEADEKHGFTKPLRTATVRWMRRWLMGVDDAVEEPDFDVRSESALQCTPHGQVMLVEGERSVFDLYVEDARELEGQREEIAPTGPGILPSPPGSKRHEADPGKDPEAAAQMTSRIRRLLQLPDRIGAPDFERKGIVNRSGYRIEKLVIDPKSLCPLPALLFRPDVKPAKLVVYLHDQGKQAHAAVGGPIETLVKGGAAVLAVDLRGFGETQMTPWRYGSMSGVLGPNSAEFFVAYLLGHSFVGLRTRDILNGCVLLDNEIDGPRSVRIVAFGETCVPALHAAAVAGPLVEHLSLHNGLVSWASVIEIRVTERQLANTVHGALRYYDLPDLRRLIGRDRLTDTDPRWANGGLIVID